MRPLLTLALLLGLILLGDRLIWATGQMVLRQSDFRFAALYDGRLTGEVAIFGDSRAVHGFYAPDLTETLCRPVVSLAYNGIGIETVAALIRDAQTHLPDLQVAVIEVTALFSQDGLTPAFRAFAPHSPALQTRLAEVSPTTLPWPQIFRSSALNSDLFYRSLLYLGRSDQTWINRGGSVSAGEIAKAQATPKGVLSEAGVRVLAETIKRLETADIEPVLIAGPVHSARRGGNWPAALAHRLGHPVHDLRRAVPDDAGFADPIHLNLGGARVLRPQLPNTLSRCAP
jgi:hypothetical protein